MKKSADRWKKEGDDFFKSGKYDLAIKSYEKANQIDPNAVDRWCYTEKGTQLSNKGKHAEAIKFFERAKELDPDVAFSYFNLGLANHNLQRFTKAIEFYDKALKLDSDYSWFWINKAAANSGLGNFTGALESIEEALKIDPNNSVAWAKKAAVLSELNNYEGAIRFYQKAIEINPKDADVWNDLGSTHFQEDNIEEAMRCYKHVIDEIDEENTWSWNNLGYCHHVKGDHSYAISCFNRAIEYMKSNYRAWCNKGGCLLEFDRLQEAEESYNETIKWFKKSHPSLSFFDRLSLSELLIMTRRFREARKLLSTSDINQTQDAVNQCLHRFLFTASYLIQSARVKRDSAKCKQSLESFLEYYKNLDESFKISKSQWNFESLTAYISKCIEKAQCKFILLCLIDLLRGKIDRRKLSFFEDTPQIDMK